MLFMAGAALLIMALAPQIISIFNRDQMVVDIGSHYLRVVSPFYVFAALGIVLGRALNGAGDSMGPMIITVATLWGLQVPLAIYLSNVWQPATQGVWWAMSIAMMVQGLLVMAWFETGRWKRIRV
jgi:Na+-driven multidrug efflux pump